METNPSFIAFTHTRTVRFQDTDAAGVVYFANVLAMCHEAYEESLAVFGVNLRGFFRSAEIVIPIVHARVDFLYPIYCGDHLSIHMTPQQLREDSFEIHYRITTQSSPERDLAKALTRHICIESMSRSRTPLPEVIVRWLQL